MTDLAKQYNISLGVLSLINNGKTYFHSNEIYPIRNGFKKIKKGIQNRNSKFTEKDLNEIFSLLKENKISMKQIANKFKVAESTIHNINKGKTYYKQTEHYPLRISKTGSRQLTYKQVLDIIIKIKNNPQKSLAQIGRELNINSKTISNINRGVIYKNPNEKYPIRKR